VNVDKGWTTGSFCLVGNGKATITAEGRRSDSNWPRSWSEKFEAATCLELSESRAAGVVEDRCNTGSMSRCGCGKGRVQAVVARLRSGSRFPHAHATGARRPSYLCPEPIPRAEPVADKANRVAIPHKGGLRFDVDSLEYRVLAEWIANGHPGTCARGMMLGSLKLEILPTASVQKKEAPRSS